MDKVIPVQRVLSSILSTMFVQARKQSATRNTQSVSPRTNMGRLNKSMQKDPTVAPSVGKCSWEHVTSRLIRWSTRARNLWAVRSAIRRSRTTSSSRLTSETTQGSDLTSVRTAARPSLEWATSGSIRTSTRGRNSSAALNAGCDSIGPPTCEFISDDTVTRGRLTIALIVERAFWIPGKWRLIY